MKLEVQSNMIICPICKSEHDEIKLKKLESDDCIFPPIENISQHIIRYQCSVCDVIFGSEEMLSLDKNKLIKAYQDIYASGYRENDATDFELSLLHLLQPNKSGIYINWGAGTSRTSIKAKDEGYSLLSYDPGMPDTFGYVTREQLTNVMVDGIISNNVLDHLQDPINELLFMKSLLKPACSMIHASDGFQYAVHYIKNHLFFFIGKSVQFISDAIGMEYSLTPSHGPLSGVDIVRWIKNDINK